jgi:hypothetical protein
MIQETKHSEEEIMKLTTDLNILTYIYKKYEPIYIKPLHPSKLGITLTGLIEIDIFSIAQHFKIHPEIMGGRLLTHYATKYSVLNNDTKGVPVFSKDWNTKKMFCDIPLLASILANMQERENNNKTAIRIAIISAILSLLSLLIDL